MAIEIYITKLNQRSSLNSESSSGIKTQCTDPLVVDRQLNICSWSIFYGFIWAVIRYGNIGYPILSHVLCRAVNFSQLSNVTGVALRFDQCMPFSINQFNII